MNLSVGPIRLAGALLALVTLSSLAAPAEAPPLTGGRADEEMALYRRTADENPLTALKRQLESGTLNWSFDEHTGYLMPLLQTLNLPASSQLLVFSKTSAHRKEITPQNPRALFFNDRVSVAYIPRSEVIEVAAADPKLGVVFYSLEQKPGRSPKLTRDDRCLECHATSKTLNVPGLLVRSFLTADDGDVSVLGGKPMVTHRTPLAERWGGYYVTGTHGAQTHLGNIFGAQAIARHEKEPAANGNLTGLDQFLSLANYPAKGSDIVALMVLEHQAQMQNLLTLYGTEAARSLRERNDLRSAHAAADAVLKYLLFVDEARLTAPVRGTSGFKDWFEAQYPRDSRQRTLARFDLETRLFRYPCSYMIYSPAFDSLPVEARKHLYRRLWEVLSGQDAAPEFASLTPALRQELREILVATKKDLPIYWKLD